MDNLVEKKKRVAIIPARGGSKRIPKKNIIELAGKPMIAHTIEAALNSELFDDVIVSTDDEEIANISENFGASIPFIRESLADDFAPISEVSVQVLEKLQSEKKREYDIAVQLMANCPLRTSGDIVKACNYFESHGHAFQISCFKYGWMNPWWAHQLDDNNLARPIFPDEVRNQRSQDQPEIFCPTGAIWIAKVQKLIAEKTFYGPKYRFFPMNWKSAVDIDDYDDLEMAKSLF